MDLPTLQAKVIASRLLTEQEKQYWAQNLPKMNPEQLNKLEGILLEAEKIPWQEQMDNYIKLVEKGTAFLQTKAA